MSELGACAEAALAGWCGLRGWRMRGEGRELTAGGAGGPCKVRVGALKPLPGLGSFPGSGPPLTLADPLRFPASQRLRVPLLASGDIR